MTQQALAAYAAEIGPLVRNVKYQKDRLKDFKESDETAVSLIADVKAAQEALKAYIETSDDAKEIIDDLTAAEIELDEALKAAARSTKGTDKEYKKGDLKPYFVARNNDLEGKAVKKVIAKGDTFEELDEELKKVEV